MKKLLILALCVIALVVTWKQYRHFYQVGNVTLTVWKKWGGYCYITPYKYWGISAPEKNYIKMSNLGDVHIYVDKDSTLLIFNHYINDTGGGNKVECNLTDYRYQHFDIKKHSSSEIESWHKKFKSIDSLKLPYIYIDVRWMQAEIENSSNVSP